MGIFSNQIEASALVAGDHVYTYRKSWGYLYAHHGIYLDDDRVIHFMGDPSLMIMVSGNGMISPMCEACGFDGMLVGVLSSCLKCFLKGGKLRRFGYGVSRAERIAAVRAGCCSMVPSDELDTVRTRAAHFLARKTFGQYHVLHNNCLHFAFYCKTGLIDRYEAEPEPESKPSPHHCTIIRRECSVSSVEQAIAATIPHRSNFALILLGSTLRAVTCCFIDPHDEDESDRNSTGFTLDAGDRLTRGFAPTYLHPEVKASRGNNAVTTDEVASALTKKLQLESTPSSGPALFPSLMVILSNLLYNKSHLH